MPSHTLLSHLIALLLSLCRNDVCKLLCWLPGACAPHQMHQLVLTTPGQACELGGCRQVNHRGAGHNAKVDEGDDGSITAVALRDIEAGEEVRHSCRACRMAADTQLHSAA